MLRRIRWCHQGRGIVLSFSALVSLIDRQQARQKSERQWRYVPSIRRILYGRTHRDHRTPLDMCSYDACSTAGRRKSRRKDAEAG